MRQRNSPSKASKAPQPSGLGAGVAVACTPVVSAVVPVAFGFNFVAQGGGDVRRRALGEGLSCCDCFRPPSAAGVSAAVFPEGAPVVPASGAPKGLDAGVAVTGAPVVSAVVPVAFGLISVAVGGGDVRRRALGRGLSCCDWIGIFFKTKPLS